MWAAFKSQTMDKNITEHDKALLREAHALHFTEWYRVRDLADKAESSSVKDALLSIEAELYHIEECVTGSI